jgi:hypothetical protein
MCYSSQGSKCTFVWDCHGSYSLGLKKEHIDALIVELCIAHWNRNLFMQEWNKSLQHASICALLGVAHMYILDQLLNWQDHF